jgi:hypothetical protein
MVILHDGRGASEEYVLPSEAINPVEETGYLLSIGMEMPC